MFLSPRTTFLILLTKKEYDPQNGTKKLEHPQRSGFFELFDHIVQCSFNRMLTLR